MPRDKVKTTTTDFLERVNAALKAHTNRNFGGYEALSLGDKYLPHGGYRLIVTHWRDLYGSGGPTEYEAMRMNCDVVAELSGYWEVIDRLPAYASDDE
jgi:hypothetical protein